MMEMNTPLKFKVSNLSVHDIVLIPLLSASLTAGKMALSFIPNVEIVTLLFMVYASVFGFKKTFLVSIIFSTIEIFLYGLQTWLIGYYILWPLLIFLSAMLYKKTQSEWPFAFLALTFGLCFGLFFAMIESIFYGFSYGIVYWLRGIPFDVVHGASNFVLGIFLYRPLEQLLSHLRDKYAFQHVIQNSCKTQ